MKMMKKIGVLASVLFLTTGIQAIHAAVPAAKAAPAAATQSALKIAVVNVQEVLRQSPKVNAISKKLENEFKTRQAKIGERQKAIQDGFDKLKKEAPTMSQKDNESAQKKLTNERADLVKEVVAYQQDVQKEQNKAMEGILADLNSIVSDIAKKQGYDLVLDYNAVIFAVNGNDITRDVAKRFNEKG
jgi:outer membrane protein